MIETLAILSKNDQLALAELKKILVDTLGNSLVEIRLFGSKVKGHSTPYSDLDILVIVTCVSRKIKDVVYEAVVDMNLKYDVVISPLIYSVEGFNDERLKTTCFYQTTHNEGIPL